jgi:cell division protein FtsZ
MPGLINLDFADIRTVMSEMGKAMMGTGEAEGEKRAIEAAEAAISNPLLDEVSMNGARGVLINITGGMDLALFEVDAAANRVREEVDPDANIIFGSTFDSSMEGRMRVSVVATGIEAPEARAAAAALAAEQQAAAAMPPSPAGLRFQQQAHRPRPAPFGMAPRSSTQRPAEPSPAMTLRTASGERSTPAPSFVPQPLPGSGRSIGADPRRSDLAGRAQDERPLNLFERMKGLAFPRGNGGTEPLDPSASAAEPREEPKAARPSSEAEIDNDLPAFLRREQQQRERESA